MSQEQLQIFQSVFQANTRRPRDLHAQQTEALIRRNKANLISTQKRLIKLRETSGEEDSDDDPNTSLDRETAKAKLLNRL
jgi:hypothetical protein